MRIKEENQRIRWKYELARDFLALGSWIFYVMVIARALIGPYRPFVDQIVIAGVVLMLLGSVVKRYEGYGARGIVLAFFTSIFYADGVFTAFASAVALGLSISSYVLHRDMRRVVGGVIAGVVGIAAGWTGATLSYR